MDKTEKKILSEEKHIEAEEVKIEKVENKLLRDEEVLVGTVESGAFKRLMEGGRVLREAAHAKKIFVKKIAKHKFVFTLIVSTGIILVWRGIWEYSATLPILSSSLIALFVVMGILWLIEKYSDLQ